MRNEEEITDFIHETDFAQSYLVIIDSAAWPSEYWLELARIDRTESGLEIAIVSASPEEPVGDDAAVHSLAIRVTDDNEEVPASIKVTVNGTPTGTVDRG